MHSSVFVTVPDTVTAKKIGRSMVEMGLAACVNTWPIGSVYRWKGDVLEDDEVAMLFKVDDSLYDELYKALLEVHPYEVPCIVRYSISEGHAAFLAWITDSTRGLRH